MGTEVKGDKVKAQAIQKDPELQLQKDPETQKDPATPITPAAPPAVPAAAVGAGQAAAGQAAATQAGGEPKRKDQVKCPGCGKWGCPASGGVHQRHGAIFSYRECVHCGRSFLTKWVHGSDREEFVG